MNFTRPMNISVEMVSVAKSRPSKSYTLPCNNFLYLLWLVLCQWGPYRNLGVGVWPKLYNLQGSVENILEKSQPYSSPYSSVHVSHFLSQRGSETTCRGDSWGTSEDSQKKDSNKDPSSKHVLRSWTVGVLISIFFSTTYHFDLYRYMYKPNS